ncbi:hypothetical protein [Mesorhizobium sp. INR15]|uniref:hypothetical protein n=1 Tax=Mesorhizobium sp. INR15 TaxID=2654248 RepID=UPI0018965836|nr:hypothetical protein [Mesorhizobium sp. INR15]QPC95407.1 hypothetical protein GA829_32795 [Mesorhizobium sp. INR15]
MQDTPGKRTENMNSSAPDHSVSDIVDVAGKKVTAALAEAKQGLSDKVGDVTSEGQEALADKAEAVQNDLSSAIAAFGGAVRAASQHLANSDQRGASRFALDAAGGLERMAASLKDKPFSDVLSEIRAFGAQNPGVLVGGSVVAGLALGRFIKSSSPTGFSEHDRRDSTSFDPESMGRKSANSAQEPDQ